MSLKIEPNVLNGVGKSIKDEYATHLIEYPLSEPVTIPVGVYVTSQMYDLYAGIFKYLPFGATISKALVRQEDYAKEGLNKLFELNSNFDINSVVVEDSTNQSQVATVSGSGFFSQQTSTQTTQTTQTSSLTRTHPWLNGKFKDNYLHQIDFSVVATKLNSLGYVWDVPGKDDFQKGVLLEIALTGLNTSTVADIFAFIKTIITNNFKTVSDVELNGNVIKVTFKSSDVYNFSTDYGILNIGKSSNVSDCFGPNITAMIYSHLKRNSYGDLEEEFPAHMMKGMPKDARKKGSLLASALSSILIDVLGGSNGVISNLQSSTNEYLMGIINGLVAANRVVYDELDRLGGGSVRKDAMEAFEAAMIKTTPSNSVSTMLLHGLEIDSTRGKSLATRDDQTTASNIKSTADALSKSRNQAKS